MYEDMAPSVGLDLESEEHLVFAISKDPAKPAENVEGLDTLLYSDVNAQSIELFINLSEDDDLYYTLMVLLDPPTVCSVGSYCGDLAVDKSIERFSILGLLTGMLKYSKHMLLKRSKTDESKAVKTRLVAVSENMTKLREMFSCHSYETLNGQYHPFLNEGKLPR